MEVFMDKTYHPEFRFRTALVLFAIILVTCLIVFNEYIFGNRILAFYDIGSDTSQQYLPQILSVVRKYSLFICVSMIFTISMTHLSISSDDIRKHHP